MRRHGCDKLAVKRTPVLVERFSAASYVSIASEALQTRCHAENSSAVLKYGDRHGALASGRRQPPGNAELPGDSRPPLACSFSWRPTLPGTMTMTATVTDIQPPAGSLAASPAA